MSSKQAGTGGRPSVDNEPSVIRARKAVAKMPDAEGLMWRSVPLELFTVAELCKIVKSLLPKPKGGRKAE